MGLMFIQLTPKQGARFWICKECNSLLRNIHTTRVQRDNVSFGDDGAYFASNDYLGKLIDEFAERYLDDEVIEKLDSLLGGEHGKNSR